MYKALYRKWRPMVFSDVIGQRHVTDTLRRQIAEGRLSHAYLFTGTRGTGKTTCAKLLAKAANCKNPRDGEPCNECDSCVGINDGSVIDVVEIDAASNSGVDNIRQIREQTVFTPQEARMRVYIIDECHMLSGGAFNALLKTLEEPPSYVLFVLATTELHKVPATILSRCQRFAFRRIAPADIAERLSRIAREEGISLTDGGARLLSELADGSLRDAISLLDQCAAIGGDSVTEETVLFQSGFSGSHAVSALVRDLADGNTAPALARVSDLYADGRDMTALLSELLDVYRDLLVVSSTGDRSLAAARTDSSLFELELPMARLTYGISVLQDALLHMRRSFSHRTDAELAIIRLSGVPISAEPAGAPPAVRFSPGTGGKAKTPEKTEDSPAVHERKADVSSAPSTEDGASERPAEPEGDVQLPADPPPPEPAKAGGTMEFWPELLERLKERIPISTHSHLATGKTPLLEGDTLVLFAGTDFKKKLLEKGSLLSDVSREASALFSREITAVVRLEGEEAEAAPSDRAELLFQKEEKFKDLFK
ncbi:DNA polymerase III subunit gamma/tau [Oscillospiraceae bacterium OttesenSCG-928-G22]|nr:DNA polymerase III subunit gamma/tau [Oscillospiraceae bacterium OttesenSCG-928-G22]